MQLSDINRAKMQQAFRPVVDLKAHRAKIKAEKESAVFIAKLMANEIRSAVMDDNIKCYLEGRYARKTKAVPQIAHTD